MKNLFALTLITLFVGWAVWMSAHAPLPGKTNAEADYPPNLTNIEAIPQPPAENSGPAAYLAYGYELQTLTAEPLAQATQKAQMTAFVLEQKIFTDSLTATAASAATQQSLNLTATPIAQTATARVEATAQTLLKEQATQTATAGLAATQLAQTQIAPLIRAQADAARQQGVTQIILSGILAVASAILVLVAVVHYKEYLDDRRTKRRDESIRARVIPREGASPLFVTVDEKPLDPDKAFHVDITRPAPSLQHQERVTQRAQTVQLARAFAQALSAAPGTHTANFLASLAQLTSPGEPAASQPKLLTPELRVLDAPPPYAEGVESQLLIEVEGAA